MNSRLAVKAQREPKLDQKRVLRAAMLKNSRSFASILNGHPGPVLPGIQIATGPMELRLPAIKGIGGAPLYLIDRFEDGKSIYDIDFEFVEGVDRHPVGHGLKVIDHLTHNVYRGRMTFWANFYEKLFNFREIRYFDIQGEYTGLTSKAMTAPDGKIRIPLNEESSKGSGQIEEFLMQFNGEGIQHVALLTEDLKATIDQLAMAGVPLMTAPNDVYYEMLGERLPGHGEDVPSLQTRGILMDGSGIGMSIAANKFFGVRAALVHYEVTSRRAREPGRSSAPRTSADLACRPAVGRDGYRAALRGARWRTP